ncbi:hypothetical protein OKW22_000923 [Bacilli bacterium PM5-3]|nr:hypothetical protein [Bacilli bacterium PM5-3]
MIIDEIKKIGVLIGIVCSVLVGLIFMRVDLIACYIVGWLVSYISFWLNQSFLDISGTKKGVRNNLINYLIRMFLYMLCLSLTYKFFGIEAMLIAFAGCLTIRLSILIIGIKGGMINGNNK